MNVVPARAKAPERTIHTFVHMFDSGLIWYLNRAVFHPLGYALALEDSGNEPAGWSLHYAGEPVSFEGIDEDAKFAAFQELLATARKHGVSPIDGHPFFGPKGDAQQ